MESDPAPNRGADSPPRAGAERRGDRGDPRARPRLPAAAARPLRRRDPGRRGGGPGPVCRPGRRSGASTAPAPTRSTGRSGAGSTRSAARSTRCSPPTGSGARVSWRRVSAIAVDGGVDRRTLALLAEAVFAYIDELSALSAEGYAQAQSAAAGERERQRRRLALLLLDPASDEALIATTAAEAGWEAPARLAALAWSTGGRRLLPRLPAGTLIAEPGDDGGPGLAPDRRSRRPRPRNRARASESGARRGARPGGRARRRRPQRRASPGGPAR